MAVVVVPLSVHGYLASDWFAETETAAPAPLESAYTDDVWDTPLLSARTNPDPVGGRGGAEISAIDGALVSNGPVGADVIAEQSYTSGEIRVYTVRPGDSLSEIAEMFGVSANTILWANDLRSATSIQPGQTLVILPIEGVRHIVKSGDTISTIAEKYEGDVEEILEYNQLASANELSVGDELIIPGGALHSSGPVRTYAAAEPVRSSGAVASGMLSHPVPGAIKTQGIHGYNAVDLAAGHGTPIRAAAAGEVIVSKSSGWNGGYGQYIVIRHANGVQTLYSHLMRNDVGVGAYVSQGQVIGGMGSTGRSTGTHLHFEVRGTRNPF